MIQYTRPYSKEENIENLSDLYLCLIKSSAIDLFYVSVSNCSSLLYSLDSMCLLNWIVSIIQIIGNKILLIWTEASWIPCRLARWSSIVSDPPLNSISFQSNFTGPLVNFPCYLKKKIFEGQSVSTASRSRESFLGWYPEKTRDSSGLEEELEEVNIFYRVTNKWSFKYYYYIVIIDLKYIVWTVF